MVVIRSLSSLVALAMVFAPACNKDDAPAGTPAASTSPSSTPTPPPETKASPDTKAPIATPTTPVVARPPAAIPTMPAIEPLLDLVASSSDVFVVTRAPLDFVDGLGGIVLGGKTAWTRVLDAVADPARPGGDAGIRKLLNEFDALRTTLVSTGLHLDKGIVVSGRSGGGQAVLVLAADDVETLPKILLTFDPTPDGDPMRCKALPDHAGWVACGTHSGALEEYQPGKGGAALAASLTADLGANAMTSLNLVARAPVEGTPGTMAMHTTGGVLQADFVGAPLAAFAEIDAPGPATALSLIAPGGSFLWVRYDVEAALRKAKEVPAMAAGMVRALSGEVLISGVAGVPGIAMLVGLNDPTPIAGLIPMASLAKDKLPKTLPDGSAMAFTVEEADDGSGGKIQVARLTIDPVGEMAAIRDQLGWKTEVVAFVTKQFFAIGLGTSTALIPEVAKASATGASEALLAGLPAGLASDLTEGKASFVMHWELDGLHAPGVREQFSAALATLPVGSVPAGVVLDAAYAAAAPLSSISTWSSSGASGVVVHVAFRGFGDTSSDEGKAAATARVDVASAKRDAATAYGALVTAYPSSPRLAAYRARAGQGTTGAATEAAAVAGVLSAIAIPAIVKYRAASAKPPIATPAPAPAP